MASLIPSGSASGTGSMTLAAPVTNSNQTATLPDATGTVMVSGNMPAFSAYLAANQSPAPTSGVWTKVKFDTKEFDTASCYDATTNYLFTPTIAGYYQMSFGADLKGTVSTRLIGVFYKNGSYFKSGSGAFNGAASTEFESTGSALIYCNGSTDYIEIYIYIDGTSPVVYGGNNITYFQGVLVRSA